MEVKIDLSFKLNGKNYMMWASAMENNLKGKKLWGYVMGTVPEPQLKLTKMEGDQEKALEGDARLKAIEDYNHQMEDWESNHAKILAWFMNNVELKVCANIAKFRRANEAWFFMKGMFTQKDLARAYFLQEKVRTTKQGDMSIQDYYSALNPLWDELALLEPKWVSMEDVVLRQKQMEQDRLFQFLFGLRPEFEQVRSSLLHRSTFPPLEEAIAEITQEETRHSMGKSIEEVLAVSKPGNHVKTYKPPHFGKQGSGGRKMIICHHCYEPGHIKPVCPKLNGAFKPKVASVEESTTKEDDGKNGDLKDTLGQISLALQQILKVTSSTSGAAIASSSPPGTYSWILDSGASFHMTPHENALTNVHANSKLSCVSTADGTFLKINGIGTLDSKNIQNFLVPKVRIVPKLNLNLFSVSQIADHGCEISFSSQGCFVQDLRSGKRIGQGHRKGDLYFMDNLTLPNTSFCTYVQDKNIETWHKRLGHPSYSKMYLFPFGNKFCKEKDINCKDCIFGKMKSIPFPTRTFVTTRPFELVHSDVWGPSPVLSKGGYSYYVTFIDDLY